MESDKFSKTLVITVLLISFALITYGSGSWHLDENEEPKFTEKQLDNYARLKGQAIGRDMLCANVVMDYRYIDDFETLEGYSEYIDNGDFKTQVSKYADQTFRQHKRKIGSKRIAFCNQLSNDLDKAKSLTANFLKQL